MSDQPKLPSLSLSRRDFLLTGLVAPALTGTLSRRSMEEHPGATTPASTSTILSLDWRQLVSRADLTYDKPASRSEEGMPVGNGRTGSLVWTSASGMHFQINRPDVFANNRNTNSFDQRNTDYASGCAYVDLDFLDFGDDVFSGKDFRQHLAAYDALMTVKGRGVTARVLAWHAKDVLAVEIEDRRSQPAPVNIDLRMLRYKMVFLAGKNYELEQEHTVVVPTRNQTSASRLEIRNGRIILTQEFREGTYYNASAVAVGVQGRKARAKFVNNFAVRVSAAPGQGRFTVLIASAASFDPKQDIAALALDVLEAGKVQGFGALLASNKTWWHDFWARAFIHLHSADGIADFVEQNYTYFLYVMASSSRGAFMPRYGGMLWYTTGDMREWGAQNWWSNAECYYGALPPSSRFELMDPMFDTYSGMYDSLALAARQQWGSQGIYIPETTWFDGLAELPDDIAAEMRDLYLLRKPWAQKSERFSYYARSKHPHNSRWNWKNLGKWVQGHWVYHDKGDGPYGATSHFFSSGAKIAFLYWLRYRYTMDTEWLGKRAYPMIKGVAEFYRNYPNVRKGADGKYHIYHVNNDEAIKGARDTIQEITAMRGLFPVLIRASEILNRDSEMRPKWREFLENLAPYPTNASPGAPNPRQPGEPLYWIDGLPPVIDGKLGGPGLSPALHYNVCTLETADPEMLRIANTTYDIATRPGIHQMQGPVPVRPFSYDITAHPGIHKDTPISVLDFIGTIAAHLGRAHDIKYILPNQIRCLRPDLDFCDWVGGGRTGVLRNRMTLREGPGAIGVERLGRISEALHAALLHSSPPAPAEEPVIRVFPAWPREWDAEFSLLAQGAFLVTSAMRSGKIEFVEFRSRAGGECRLRNPWGSKPVTLYRTGGRSQELEGSLLKFETAKEEVIAVVQRGTSPESFRRTVMG